MRGNARIEEQVPCQEPDELWPVSSPELNRTKRNYVGAGGSREGGGPGSSPKLDFTKGFTKGRDVPEGEGRIQPDATFHNRNYKGAGRSRMGVQDPAVNRRALHLTTSLPSLEASHNPRTAPSYLPELPTRGTACHLKLPQANKNNTVHADLNPHSGNEKRMIHFVNGSMLPQQPVLGLRNKQATPLLDDLQIFCRPCGARLTSLQTNPRGKPCRSPRVGQPAALRAAGQPPSTFAI